MCDVKKRVGEKVRGRVREERNEKRRKEMEKEKKGNGREGNQSVQYNVKKCKQKFDPRLSSSSSNDSAM